MRNLARELTESRHVRSKVYQLGGLMKTLEAHLPDGELYENDIESLKGVKGVGSWSLTRLKSLFTFGECDYLTELRTRAVGVAAGEEFV